MSPNWVIHRIYNFVMEIKLAYCGINAHEAELEEEQEARVTSEPGTAPRQVACFSWSSDCALETQRL